MVNLDWYFDTFIMAMASPKLGAPVFPSVNLTRQTDLDVGADVRATRHGV